MSWQDRVNPVINLRSPSGQQFVALWRGNKRSKAKKLGIFEYPGAKGVLVQDLDMGGAQYPTTFYFEGENHDLEAQRFWSACDERGTWLVKHPTKGDLTLQLIEVSEDVQPVEAGNITQYECDWIEPGVNNPAASVAQLEDDVVGQIEAVQSAAFDQFAAEVKVGTPSQLAQLTAAAKRVVSVVDAIKSTATGITATVTAARTLVLGVVQSATLNVVSLASALDTLVNLPGAVLTDARARFDYFEKLINGAVALNSNGVNAAAVHELVATSGIAGMAQAVVASAPATRESAVQYLERVQAAFATVTRNLDAAQELYEDKPIDQQYFSQSNSFTDTAELLRRVQELLLRRSFDLAAAKRITLRRGRCPVEIALTERMDLDAFIAANALKGNDILMLQPGRQVVVYQ